MRSTARSVRRPDPAPRAPRPGPALAPAWPGRTPSALQVSAGTARSTAAPAPPTPRTSPVPSPPPAAPGPAPRPAPRVGAVLPPPPPEKVAILVHCLRPPAVGASGPGCSPCPASGDRWVATGLQVRLLAALARPGGVARVGGSALFPGGYKGDLRDPRWRRGFLLLWRPGLTPNSDLCLDSERLEGCSRPYTPGLKCNRGSG